MASRNATPVYVQVAVDVAGRVAREELVAGQKISGRSTLASEYGVSPETIRKAMQLLEDVNIVEVKHGNGVYVVSIVHAEEFMERYSIKASINELKDELIEMMRQRDVIEKKMNHAMNSIIDYSNRFKNSDHIIVHEYFLNYDIQIEKSIMDLNLKKETGITLVGLKRDDVVILSPDDEEIIRSKDKLLYVGGSNTSHKLSEYLENIYAK